MASESDPGRHTGPSYLKSYYNGRRGIVSISEAESFRGPTYPEARAVKLPPTLAESGRVRLAQVGAAFKRFRDWAFDPGC